MHQKYVRIAFQGKRCHGNGGATDLDRRYMGRSRYAEEICGEQGSLPTLMEPPLPKCQTPVTQLGDLGWEAVPGDHRDQLDLAQPTGL